MQALHMCVKTLKHEPANHFIDNTLAGERNPETNEQELTINRLM